jgi:hypothetical protein
MLAFSSLPAESFFFSFFFSTSKLQPAQDHCVAAD